MTTKKFFATLAASTIAMQALFTPIAHAEENVTNNTSYSSVAQESVTLSAHGSKKCGKAFASMLVSTGLVKVYAKIFATMGDLGLIKRDPQPQQQKRFEA